MGSIENLLNPLSIPFPKPTSLSPTQKRAGGTEEGATENVMVIIEAEVECRSNVEMATRDRRPVMTAGGVDSSSKDDGIRRTSSSSLADLLNLPEESQVTASNGHPQSKSSEGTLPAESRAKSPRRLNPFGSQFPSKSASISVQSGLEEMSVDVLATTELSIPPQNIETLHFTLPTVPSTDNQPIQTSPSADFQVTISPSEPAAATHAIIPSRSPSPSKKRKFTPESSPDEPLSAGPSPPVSQLLQLDPEIHSEISVEKPQPTPRAVKKPKRPAQIKRPAHVKKKSTATNGQKKVNRKQKEESASVSFDNVRPRLVMKLTSRVLPRHQLGNQVFRLRWHHLRRTTAPPENRSKYTAFVVNQMKDRG